MTGLFALGWLAKVARMIKEAEQSDLARTPAATQGESFLLS
jgi:hypothetical protein